MFKAILTAHLVLAVCLASVAGTAYALRDVQHDVQQIVLSSHSFTADSADLALLDISQGTADCVEALSARYGEAAIIDSWSIESLCDFESGGAQ